jgi:hypothetical protein
MFDPSLSVIEFGAQQLHHYPALPNGTLPFAHELYFELGYKRYMSLDNEADFSKTGTHNVSFDLSCPISKTTDTSSPFFMPQNQDRLIKPATLVTDFGTSEHMSGFSVTSIQGLNTKAAKDGSIPPEGVPVVFNGTKEQAFYYCTMRKILFCESGGLIISENPHTEHWTNLLHHPNCHHWFTEDFYPLLCEQLPFLHLIDSGTHYAMNNTVDGKEVFSVIAKHEDIRASELISEALPFELFMERVYNKSIKPF